MPATSKAQFRLMKAVENNPKVAKKVGMSSSQAAEYTSSNKGKKAYSKLPAKKALGGSMDDDYNAPARTKYRPGRDARSYDSDIDYYDSFNRDDDGGEEDKTPSRVVKAEDRRMKQYRKAVDNVAKKYTSAKKSGDEAGLKKAQDRWSRVQLSKDLQTRAKVMPRLADQARKDWSEKIGGGKPAPFKKGGKVNSCW